MTIVTGNVTRTCGVNNEWLPAKIYCISDEFSMVFTEVCSATCLQVAITYCFYRPWS